MRRASTLRHAVRRIHLSGRALNLAFVCEKLKAYAEANSIAGVCAIDPTVLGELCRPRCTSSKATKSAGTT